MFLLLSPAFASTVTVPVRVTFDETTEWGADPEVVDDVLSATVAVTDTVSGAALPADGELLLKERTGAGSGELTFPSATNGSLHTWAVLLLDAHGVPLQEKPEIVDVLFGDDGDGTIVARESADIVVKTIKMKKRGSSRAEDGSHDVRVVVAAGGTAAAYVGIQELATDGVALGVHADLEAMTAEVYAAFQGLALDAIVPLDTWSAVLQGDLDVDGVTLDDNGKPLNLDAVSMDVDFWGPPVKDDPDPVPTVSQRWCCMALQIRSKRRDVQPLAWRVNLSSDEAIPDVFDGAVDLVVDGDARALEVATQLSPVGAAPKATTDILQLLDPSDVAVAGTATATGTFPTNPAEELPRDLWIRAINKEGKPLDDWRTCVLTPTAASAVKDSKTLRWTGECLRDDDLGADIRGVSMKLTNKGAATLSAELVGLQYESATTIEFAVDGKSLGVTSAKAAAAVSETTFGLGWTFPTDPDQGSYTLTISFYGANTTPDSELVGTGGYSWETLSEQQIDNAKEGVSDAVKQAYLEDQKEKLKK